VSNHSYGIASGWDGDHWYGDLTINTDEDYMFGFYDGNAYDFDLIAYNAPNYLICVGAGNDRNDTPWMGTHYHWNGVMFVAATDPHGADGQFGGYDTISAYAVAKNVLTVGAVNDIPLGYSVPADVVQTSFSSWGPCDDGRVKPDIVANGASVYSITDVSTTSYGSMSGTSMATPNVSGSIDLIAHEYNRRFGRMPLSSTLKAIVINTADEAGPNDGPDYSNGWGLLNTHRAIDLIGMHGNEAGGTYEWTINTGEVHEYYFSVDAPQDVGRRWPGRTRRGPCSFPRWIRPCRC
jgi:subtilisin family serine protease